jgi:phage shock protein A
VPNDTKHRNSVSSTPSTPSSVAAWLDSADNALNLASLTKAAGGKLDLDPDNPENGLAKLVLAVIELLRQLCERQAVRRMDSGSLSDAEVEKLGEAFMRLEQKMIELKALFGLEDDELDLDLGPLGKLL